MRTYLLEKSRVVFQAENERNYHIFYQLCIASTLPEMKYLQLRDQSEFAYTRQGHCALIKGVDDMSDFKETCKSLDLLGFSEIQQKEFFSIVAAVLHSGNINFLEAERDGCKIDDGDEAFTAFCVLMGLDDKGSADMRKYLCFREIISMKEVFTKPMTNKEASSARDALAKHVYSLLFSMMVTLINKSLAGKN